MKSVAGRTSKITYTPLSLKKLCINTILFLFPNDTIHDILIFLHLENMNFEHEFESRREILKWCLSKE